MAAIVNSSFLANAYDYYLWTDTLSDPRTKGWLMVDSPVPTIIGILLYFFIVWAGPKAMKKRRPFEMNWLMIPYNFIMTFLNAYIVAQLYIGADRLNYNYICEPCRPVKHPEEIRIASAIWWYYFSKMIEFSDTFIFILRKKERQLTFLHVYHHSTIFAFWWIGVKYVPSGSAFFPAMINSAVHVIMYGYYGLAACGPAVSKYLWWKKYITMIQLIQFVFALSMGTYGWLTGCDFPTWMQIALILYMVSFLVLFGNFYIKSYMNKSKAKSDARKKLKMSNNNNENEIKSHGDYKKVD